MKTRNKEQGMAILEFALLMPMFLIALFAVIEFGSAVLTHQILTASAREAARFGMRTGDPRPSEAAIQQKAFAYVDNSGLDASKADIIVSGAGGEAGENLTVTVKYPANFSFLSGYVAAQLDIPENLDLRAEVVLELN